MKLVMFGPEFWGRAEYSFSNAPGSIYLLENTLEKVSALPAASKIHFRDASRNGGTDEDSQVLCKN